MNNNKTTIVQQQTTTATIEKCRFLCARRPPLTHTLCQGSSIVGLSRKGKEFFRMASPLSETIHHMAVQGERYGPTTLFSTRNRCFHETALLYSTSNRFFHETALLFSTRNRFFHETALLLFTRHTKPLFSRNGTVLHTHTKRHCSPHVTVVFAKRQL